MASCATGMLHVAEATAQIYAIDSFAAGAPIDHVRLANLLQVTEENFEAIRNCIEKNNVLYELQAVVVL